MSQTPAPQWAQALNRLTTYLSQDFLGGPRPLALSTVINFQKGLTAPFVLALMALYGNFSTTAWVYLALHGSYGLLWLMKHKAFPDARWERRITLGGALLSFLAAMATLIVMMRMFRRDWTMLPFVLYRVALGLALLAVAYG